MATLAIAWSRNSLYGSAPSTLLTTPSTETESRAFLASSGVSSRSPYFRLKCSMVRTRTTLPSGVVESPSLRLPDRRALGKRDVALGDDLEQAAHGPVLVHRASRVRDLHVGLLVLLRAVGDGPDPGRQRRRRAHGQARVAARRGDRRGDRGRQVVAQTLVHPRGVEEGHCGRPTAVPSCARGRRAPLQGCDAHSLSALAAIIHHGSRTHAHTRTRSASRGHATAATTAPPPASAGAAAATASGGGGGGRDGGAAASKPTAPTRRVGHGRGRRGRRRRRG